MIVKNIFKISKGKKAVESIDKTLQRYIQIGDLRSDDKIKYAESDDKNVICDENDVLIAWDGANAGTIGYGLKGIIGSTLARLSPKVDNIYSPYAGRFLQSQFRYLRETCTGATIPHISRPTLESLKIPLPPLDQQKKIAAILDAADAYRQKTKALITKYEELTQSLFLDMFGDPVRNPMGWDKFTLDKCYINKKEGTKCGPFGSALKKHEYVDCGIPVWTMYNIRHGGFDKNKCLFITVDKYNALKSYETKLGDIIISRAGTVGKMCVITHNEKAIISTNLIRLRLDSNKLLPMYFALLMNKWGAKVARLKTGAEGTFTHMNTGILNSINLPIPPISIQNQFANRVQALETQKVQAQASLAQAEDLFNSLLQKAFKGELV
ncbi:restriction endonuclease subunit S [Psychroserpens burtonensis]|uniref:restriction endonuclease subunit S n=1 Tax=Psychroserpens burtonensis TaxID=49278 RepID=UPI0004083D5A|nr:restriction endonuclease subunit S [Psychroserpens burtonensis]